MALKVHSAIIWTEDIERLLPFYRDTLGLAAEMESPEFAVLGGGKLGLGKHSEVKGTAKDPYRLMLNLEVESTQAEYERLKSKGVGFIREPEEEGGVMIATFADPDGNVLQLFEQL